MSTEKAGKKKGDRNTRRHQKRKEFLARTRGLQAAVRKPGGKKGTSKREGGDRKGEDGPPRRPGKKRVRKEKDSR